ncbi:MAG: hypothetical protein QF787_17780, partial [Nitrospinota bacterium]|nr:hypothetical protein [Nitrospinota bacterium]
AVRCFLQAPDRAQSVRQVRIRGCIFRREADSPRQAGDRCLVSVQGAESNAQICPRQRKVGADRVIRW